MTDIQRILLTNIKKYRSKLNYSQMKLAELSGVSTSFIGEIEIGRKYPSAKTLQRLVNALEIKPYKLFMDVDDVDEFNRDGLLGSFKEKIQDHFVSELEIVYSQFTEKEDILK